jgi:hypothetical protein
MPDKPGFKQMRGEALSTKPGFPERDLSETAGWLRSDRVFGKRKDEVLGELSANRKQSSDPICSVVVNALLYLLRRIIGK